MDLSALALPPPSTAGPSLSQSFYGAGSSEDVAGCGRIRRGRSRTQRRARQLRAATDLPLSGGGTAARGTGAQGGRRRPDGLGGPRRWPQRAPLTVLLDFFISLTEAGIRPASVNHLIYRDEEREADGLAGLGKLFLPA